jgi:hypothetical protein
MKSSIRILSMILIPFLLSVIAAQDSTRTLNQNNNGQHGVHFIDEDGDGYNDNAPDHDGDGTPNGLDPDWQKDKESKGKRNRWRFVDLDGDGINDNLQEEPVKSDLNGQIQNQQQKSSSIEGQEKMDGEEQKRKRGGKE